jgi:hypothetical protein
MLKTTISTHQSVSNILLLLAVVAAIGLYFLSPSIVLTVVVALPIALLGLLLRFRSAEAWRCSSCGKLQD